MDFVWPVFVYPLYASPAIVSHLAASVLLMKVTSACPGFTNFARLRAPMSPKSSRMSSWHEDEWWNVFLSCIIICLTWVTEVWRFWMTILVPWRGDTPVPLPSSLRFGLVHKSQVAWTTLAKEVFQHSGLESYQVSKEREWGKPASHGARSIIPLFSLSRPPDKSTSSVHFYLLGLFLQMFSWFSDRIFCHLANQHPGFC